MNEDFYDSSFTWYFDWHAWTASCHASAWMASSWNQGGYLYGTSALFLLDEEGRMLIWLSAGTAMSRTEAHRYIEREFLAGRG